ncbi:MAG: hypothetical protein WDW38_006680 [Sanguina aurantia]
MVVSVNGINTFDLINDVNVVRLYTPTLAVTDSAGSLDEHGIYKPEGQAGTGNWQLLVNDTSHKMCLEFEAIAEKYSLDFETVRMVSHQLHVKRARGFMVIFFFLRSVNKGQWFVLEEPRLLKRIQRHAPALHSRMCGMFGVPSAAAPN